VLRAHDIAEHIVDREHAATADYRLAKTNDRSVLGVMNEFVRLADWRRDEITSFDDLSSRYRSTSRKRLAGSLPPPHQSRP
jgi:hypothetical protein